MLAIVVVAVAAVSSSALTWRRNAILREIEEDADTAGRYCDMGIRLRVIARDEAHGTIKMPGLPPMRLVREHRLGGMVDLWGADDELGRPTICGPSRAPVIWYASEAQAPLILHDDADPPWTLIQGSEGSGKTYSLAMWSAVRVVEWIGRDVEIGITAPITRRMEHVRKAIRKLWPAHWYALHETKGEYRFRAGPTVVLASAHTSRRDEGSPIQGANWVAHGGDELQDHFDKEADIQARGRDAREHPYKRLNTSTAKDLPEWRNFRTTVENSPTQWRFVRVLGMDNPLIPPAHWHNLKHGGQYTEREWNRRVLALDVGPEAQLYYSWARREKDGSPGNICPIPMRATDVTADVLRPWAPPGVTLSMLVGHDPGKRQHVSMFLKAYRFPGRDTSIRWVVVDEVTSPDSTIQAHVVDVLRCARDSWNTNQLDHKGRATTDSGQMLVRIDPHTRSGDDHPGRDVYAIWRNAGILAKAAAFTPGATTPATIKRESRFDMMNTLLCNVNGVRRLLVACDDRGDVKAKNLVRAFESMERNAENKGETEKKNADDLSHWPAAVGYALWQIEHPRMGQVAV